MNYEQATDFDINKAVAEAKGNKHAWYEECFLIEKGPSVKYCVCCPFPTSIKLPNYCNNPGDAWPIILEHKIDIRFSDTLRRDKMCVAIYDCSDIDLYFHRHNNPLRAAMIVFLKMKEQPS